MTLHRQKQLPLPCQMKSAIVTRFPNRKSLLIPLATPVLALALVSCTGDAAPPPPPPVAVTDTRPVGEGLKLIGFSLLGAAVVIVLGRLIR